MNKSELIAKIAEKTGTNKAVSEKALNAAVEAITEALAKGEKVQVVGFGTFTVKARAERPGRNPQSGEAITIAASKAPSFSAGKALKDAINH